jgi:hypothetical protein
MLNMLTRLFGGRHQPPHPFDLDFDLQPVSSIQTHDSDVATWALQRGLNHTGRSDGQSFTLSGTDGKIGLKLECLPSQRDYIRGQELKGRTSATFNDQGTVLVINRVLKEALEKRAYSLFTKSIQTHAPATISDEMRWLALFPEIGWDSLPDEFWSRYAVMAARRQHAQPWLTPTIARLLMRLQDCAPDGPLPTILMLMRSKVYIRVQHESSNVDALKLVVDLLCAGAQSANQPRFSNSSVDTTLRGSVLSTA